MNALHCRVIDSQINRYVEELLSFKEQIKKDQGIPLHIRDGMCITLDDVISRLVYLKFSNNPEWVCDTQQ